MRVVSNKKEIICTGDIKEILKSLIDNDSNILSIEIKKIDFYYNNDIEDKYKAKIVYKWSV